MADPWPKIPVNLGSNRYLVLVSRLGGVQCSRSLCSDERDSTIDARNDVMSTLIVGKSEYVKQSRALLVSTVLLY